MSRSGPWGERRELADDIDDMPALTAEQIYREGGGDEAGWTWPPVP